MNINQAISRNPEVMSGALVCRGTRVPVNNLFDYIETGSLVEKFLADFPGVPRDQALAVIEDLRHRLEDDMAIAGPTGGILGLPPSGAS